MLGRRKSVSWRSRSNSSPEPCAVLPKTTPVELMNISDSKIVLLNSVVLLALTSQFNSSVCIFVACYPVYIRSSHYFLFVFHSTFKNVIAILQMVSDEAAAELTEVSKAKADEETAWVKEKKALYDLIQLKISQITAHDKKILKLEGEISRVLFLFFLTSLPLNRYFRCLQKLG